MKYLLLSSFILILSSINCLHLRNLKLEKDVEKYQVLCSVANKTIYQLFNVTIDFKDRYDAYVQQKDISFIKVIVNEYAKFPYYENQITFDITDEKAIIPDLNVPKEASFDVYGAHDLQEEFIIFGNMVAAGFQGYEGNVTIYRKETEFTAQARYICFVKTKSGELYGAFEVIQEDLNDRKEIKDKVKNFLKKVEEILKTVSPSIKMASEVISTLFGVNKDLNEVQAASSFIKISYLLLIINLLY